MIEICNKKTFPREWLNEPNTVYIGRPSPLGNPFVIGPDGDRNEVVAKYRTWLNDQMVVQRKTGVESPALKELNRIYWLNEKYDVIRLVCWCAPLACHGSVIAEQIM